MAVYVGRISQGISIQCFTKEGLFERYIERVISYSMRVCNRRDIESK